MARPPSLLLLVTAILLLVPACQSAKYSEDLGDVDLEVIIDVPPTARVERSKEKDEALLEEMLGYRSEQALVGGSLNKKGFSAGQAEDRMRGGNILKRSAAERQMNGRIRILKKRDNYNTDKMDNFNMDGKIRILKRAEHEMSNLRRLLEDQNGTERRNKLLKRADDDSYNVDGRIRILKRSYQERVGKTRVGKYESPVSP